MFDLWTRGRVALDDIGDAVSWGLACALVTGFMVEFGTHTQAARSGWAFPATFGELISARHYRDFLLSVVDEKDRRSVSVPFPWSVDAPASAAEIAAAEAALARVTAIRD